MFLATTGDILQTPLLLGGKAENDRVSEERGIISIKVSPSQIKIVKLSEIYARRQTDTRTNKQCN